MQNDLKLGSEWAKTADTLIREISKGASAVSEGPLKRWNQKRDLMHAMNMCNIIDKARGKKKQGNADSLEIDSGWLLNFLDKCKTVSDTEVQELWASILAKESDTQGSFSQLTVNSLENFAKRDAEWFISLCGFICNINSEPIPLIGDVTHEIYRKNGISPQALEHLSTLSVIESVTFMDGSRGTTRPREPHLAHGESILIFYFDKKLEYMNAGQSRDKLNVGTIALTSIGKELLSICDNKPVDGFFEYLRHNWSWSRMMGSQLHHPPLEEKIIRLK